MISICIPTYNFYIKSLISALEEEITTHSLDAEIIVIDDASIDFFQRKNKARCANCTYIQLEKNIGRAAIRNRFLGHAKGDYFLFLDCDSWVEKPDFIRAYLNAITEATDVICGGRIYPKRTPSITQKLNWKFGVFSESKPAETRKLKPYGSFMTNNFVVKRSVFERIQFNETLREYGHEDTLFGFELEQNNIAIQHIDNPVKNGHIESNRIFMAKTAKGIENLTVILELVENNPQFIGSVKVLAFYERLKAKKLIWCIRIIGPISNYFFDIGIRIGFISIKLFNIYKLHLLDRALRNK